jgi:hypothetical protein
MSLPAVIGNIPYVVIVRDRPRGRTVAALALLMLLLTGCGQKENPGPITFTPENRWTSKCTRCGGNPMNVKINRGLDSLSKVRTFRYQAAISVILKHPLENGLPGEDEKVELESIEKVIVSQLAATGRAVYGLEVQGNRRADYIFYTDEKRAVRAAFANIKDAIPSHQVEFSLKPDQKWYSYRWYSSWR